MLQQFTIQNFGLIERISLEFDPRLNILTGETGAGKSILIGALRVLLGERISSSQLRDSSKSCVLEGEFDLTKTEAATQECLKDYLLDGEMTLIIQRIYQPEGRNKIKVNGLSVTVGQLKEIGNVLMDFHGPHDHQMLLDPGAHADMLDRMVNFGKAMEVYRKKYEAFVDIRKKISKIDAMKESRDRDLDLLGHQVKELEQVKLDEDVYHELMNEEARVKNAEKLHEHLSQALNSLDAGSSEAIRKAFSPLSRLSQLDEEAAKFESKLSEVQALHDDLVLELRDYAENLSFEPGRADEIHSQSDMYEDIKRKYGPTIDDARKFYEEAREKYDLLVNLDHNDKDLREELKSVEKELKKSAAALTKLRQKAADGLKSTIEKELTELGIKHVRFEARVEDGEYHAAGKDKVTFFISPNAGEGLKPLAEIVSSGEAARVMLALKKALVKVDPIPILIFDEIDAQIGGRLGTVTGEKLRDISRGRQVLLITHLPQIASFADSHFKIKKSVKSGRAVTEVLALDKKARVDELAQMMSGEDASAISVKHANDMLAKAAK